MVTRTRNSGNRFAYYKSPFVRGKFKPAYIIKVRDPFEGYIHIIYIKACHSAARGSAWKLYLIQTKKTYQLKSS